MLSAAFFVGIVAATVTDEVGPKAVVPAAAVAVCDAAANTEQARTCLAAALRGLPPEAAQFAARLKDQGYLRELTETGRVDVASVTYIFRGNATTGILLVNGQPAIVDVNAPEHYKALGVETHPRYAALARTGGEIWADDPGTPTIAASPKGGLRFQFDLPFKTCRACAPTGRAMVAFDFDAAGAFLGPRLLDLKPALAPAP